MPCQAFLNSKFQHLRHPLFILYHVIPVIQLFRYDVITQYGRHSTLNSFSCKKFGKQEIISYLCTWLMLINNNLIFIICRPYVGVMSVLC